MGKESVFSIADCEDDWDSLIFFPAVKQARKCIDVSMYAVQVIVGKL